VAASIAIDIIDGALMKETDGFITDAIRIAKITGLTSSTDADVPRQALAYLDEQLITPRSAYPNERDLTLRERNVDPIGNNACVVELVYKASSATMLPPEFAVKYTGGTSLEQAQTELDGPFGKPIQVRDAAGQQQTGTISIFEPVTEITYEQIRRSSNPKALSSLYTGKLNSATWNDGVQGTWMCTGINFDFESGHIPPLKWNFEFSFRFKRRGHDPEVIFIDPVSGRPPPGLQANVGFYRVNYYDRQDFNNLGLT